MQSGKRESSDQLLVAYQSFTRLFIDFTRLFCPWARGPIYTCPENTLEENVLAYSRIIQESVGNYYQLLEHCRMF